MNIIVQTYAEANPARSAEYNTCLLNNLSHFYVKNVFNLYESEEGIRKTVREHPKYKGIHLGKRMTYDDAFKFAKAGLPLGEITCVLNLDIYIALALDYAEMCNILANGKTALAISRHDMDSKTGIPIMDPTFATIFHSNTQDGWFFKNPINMNPKSNYDIEIGRLGCDNAVALELKNDGYAVFNLPERFVLIHLDEVRGKTATNFMEFHKPNPVKYNGGFLVPNYDAVKHISIDHFMNELKFSEQERVLIFSEILNKRLAINNT